MRERFWLVLAVMLVLVIAGFASLGGQSLWSRANSPAVSDQLAEASQRFVAEVRDLTNSLAESMAGDPRSPPPVTAASVPQPPGRQ